MVYDCELDNYPQKSKGYWLWITIIVHRITFDNDQTDSKPQNGEKIEGEKKITLQQHKKTTEYHALSGLNMFVSTALSPIPE